MDEKKFRAVLEEIAAEMGRGSRVAKDKLDEWADKVKDAWPEVESSFERFGRSFAASIGAFAKAFRDAYHGEDERGEDEKE
ncbi:MAG: hypothetical protein A2Y64_04015 [Candidatus Coatesbacteria bacterium RBG_13_66_14]|uniref:Uncharacterized protein n=1 Tax=Candidatus Coatesbacteria bacterium RBG_13_66_14 TaxID=1817816 RepID=A0A1F5FIF1_9BACT|nr:MAG: hypothetical protein A2Y64_04015 [Candidatus Coatesbacteria bacterium RBG_13_66_14]